MTFTSSLPIGWPKLGDPAPILMDMPERAYDPTMRFIYGVDMAIRGTNYAVINTYTDDAIEKTRREMEKALSNVRVPTPADVLNHTSTLGRSLNADERTTVAHFMEMYAKNVITHAQVLEILGLGPNDTVTLEVQHAKQPPPKVQKGADGKYYMDEEPH